MVFGTMESRKFLTGVITKWFLFLACMSFFPAFSRGLEVFAIELGMSVSGNSVESIENRLGDFFEKVDKLIGDDLSEVEAIKSRIDSISLEKAKLLEDHKDYFKRSGYDFSTAMFGIYADDDYNWDLYNLDSQLVNLEEQKMQLEKRSGEESNKGYRKTYNAIKSVLVVDDENIADKYHLDINMKNSDGSDSIFLSPNALLRISLLAAEIMWETEWQDDFLYTWAENSKKVDKNGNPKVDKNGEVKKKLTKFPINHIFNLVLCFLCEIFLVVITIFELIQYIMCIVEYSICTSFSLVIIPCLLFDGLKDMAQKILPSLLAQAVKLSMIIICMFFCTYMYLDVALVVVSGVGFSFTMFAYIAFVCLLTLALCSNAPKLAVTLLNGQPQMSMGEFVQATGTTMAGIRMANKGLATGKEASKMAIAKTSQATANRLGDAAAMVGGARAASVAAASGGSGKFGQALNGLGGAAAVLGKRTGNRVRGMMQNAATYTGKKGGGGIGGGSGGGNNIFTSDSPDIEVSRNRSGDNQNSHSMNYLGATNNNGTKMTFGEYMKDQYQGGRNDGANFAQKNAQREFINYMNTNDKGVYFNADGSSYHPTHQERADNIRKSEWVLDEHKEALQMSNVTYSRKNQASEDNIKKNTPNKKEAEKVIDSYRGIY